MIRRPWVAAGVLAALAGCLLQREPVLGSVWAYNHGCRPIVVHNPDLGPTGAVAPTYELEPGSRAVLALWKPPPGGCSFNYALPSGFRGVAVRDDTGRAFLVDRSRFRQTDKDEVWEVDIDAELLGHAQEVDAGTYFPPDAAAQPGERSDAGAGPCEGAPR
jgi:hypothetical protein